MAMMAGWENLLEGKQRDWAAADLQDLHARHGCEMLDNV